MSCAIIVHGRIGGGKTTTCLRLAERARGRGMKTLGLLSMRVLEGGEVVGYDAVDVGTGDIFPLVRLTGTVEGDDWFGFGGLKFSFSSKGFERANKILAGAAERMDGETLVFVDEYGRIEAEGLGIHPGAVGVAEALQRGGAAVFPCRTDMVGAVRGLVAGRAGDVHVFEAGDPEEIWRNVEALLGLKV